MGLVLVPSEVAQMIKELREMLAGVMDGYKSALRAIISFSGEDELDTDTWNTFKEKVVDYHDAIVRGMILAEDSLLTDAAMEHSFGSEELDEDKLDEDIKKLEMEKQGYVSELEALRQISNSTIGALAGMAFAMTAIGILKDNISAIETEISILDAKKRRLYSIENNTRNLFESASRLLVAVKYAIRDAGVEITGEGNLSNGKWRTTISDAHENADSFQIYLRLQGFPEEYVECLMELHKKYPEWKFEAVVTGIDYQEFVDYQVGIKCFDTDDNNYTEEEISKYSTGERFKGEPYPRYCGASREGIIQFSNPYNIIMLAKDDYTCMIQFLKFEQEFPQKYVDTVVPQMLPQKKDENVVESIINSNSCINPLLLACMYKAENGPNGAEYDGKKVYNFFNIGAGGSNASEKAFKYEWFSEDDCMKGSETTFQTYINNGQDTLYALDWDYQSYANKGAARQYATLVDDAKKKAGHFKCGEKGIEDLNQSYVFKIPVYENIPPFDEEEFKTFKIPLIE